jgi:hypothetical protein
MALADRNQEYKRRFTMSHKDVPVKYYQDALQAEIDRIKSAPPDSAIAKANQHLLGATNGPTWVGAGMLELAGIGFYAVHCDLALTDISTGARVVSFSGTGLDWAVGAFHAWLAGAFVVDPKTIGGSCRYSIAFGAAAEGAATLFLYNLNSGLYGVFPGYIEVGVGVGFPQGTGDLVVI